LSARKGAGSRLEAFHHAFAGLWFVVRTQRNAWIHLTATLVVIGLGLWLQLESLEWGLLVVAMLAVWLAECLNTSLEAAIDLASPHPDPLAKAAKDVAAGAVLLAAIGAVVLGALILGPPLFTMLRGGG
jgi:diacylglycerol kinase